ncbi:MAG: DUF4089 domain-containing protein [Pseudomonadota bacterium]
MTDWDAYIDAMAPAMGLDVAEHHRPGVRQFLEIASSMAVVIEAVPLDEDALALLPVYIPPELLPELPSEAPSDGAARDDGATG